MAAVFHPWRGPACAGVLVQQLDSTARFAPRQPSLTGCTNKVGSSRAAATQRYAVARPTMNRSATSSGASPASTAISTRSRRSAEYAPAMNIGCLRSPMWARHLPYQVTRGLLYLLPTDREPCHGPCLRGREGARDPP